MTDGNILEKGTPTELLLLKFEQWLIQQPEWLAILALPRQQRRAACRTLADALYRVPSGDLSNTMPRVVRRQLGRELQKQAKKKQAEHPFADLVASVTKEDEPKVGFIETDEVVAEEPRLD